MRSETSPFFISAIKRERNAVLSKGMKLRADIGLLKQTGQGTGRPAPSDEGWENSQLWREFAKDARDLGKSQALRTLNNCLIGKKKLD